MDTVCPWPPPPPPDLDLPWARPSDRSSTRWAEIIATEDFDAVSMRRVAAKADVSLSTVVRHFGTKDALLAALVSQGGEDD